MPGRGKGAIGRKPWLLVLWLAVFFGFSPAFAAKARYLGQAKLPDGERVVLTWDGSLRLEAAAKPGEGLHAFLRRYTGRTPTQAFWEANPDRKKRLLAGVRYRVPFELLLPSWRLAVLKAVFSKDEATPSGWVHYGVGEPWTELAFWFTGDRGQAVELRSHNGASGDRVEKARRVEIPKRLLAGFLVEQLPATELPRQIPPAPQAPSDSGAPSSMSEISELQPLLEFATDEKGPVAIYRLRPGEALYSAVVVRFTGRLSAEDVNALALEIAARSGIQDVTDIPIGYPVKIPRELLLPEYLPPQDPRRLEWEVERELAGQFRNQVRAVGLEGVTVILDAGHGGADVGAAVDGVWESVYVYDVMLRTMQLLRATTHAKVFPTTQDGQREQISNRDRLPLSRGHRVLTNPPYWIEDATVGVHLRWYLSNSILRSLKREKGQDRVVFLSIHADSLHPSVRGGTFYIPAASLTAGSFAKAGSVYESRVEYREQPRVEQSAKERRRAEGLSRELAEHLTRAFAERKLKLHPYQPIRDRIYRGRYAWVPAVLRYNLVAPRVLVEVCNLANAEDRAALTTLAFRQQVAEALVQAIRSYFGEPAPAAVSAASARQGSIEATR